MKKYIYFIPFLLLTACSKFLDVQDDFSATDSAEFVLSDNTGQARRFHRAIYEAVPNYSHFDGYSSGNESLGNAWTGLTDEISINRTGTIRNILTNGYTSQTAPYHRWETLYKVIRHASIFIEKGKPIGSDGENDAITPEELKTMKATAYFFRAYAHYLLFEQYGPITIKKEIENPSNTDKRYERNSVDEVVQGIEEDLDLAIADLDDTRIYPSNPSGFDDNKLAEPTKGVALAVKAKLRVLAASPLYNGEYTEALAIRNDDGKQLFPAKDPNKWVKAKEALEELFAYAQRGNYELYKSSDNDPHKSLYELFQKYNKEIIWASSNNIWGNVEWAQTPRDIQSNGKGGTAGDLGVTQEMVDAFFMSNGLNINDLGSGYTEVGTSDFVNPANRYTAGGRLIETTDRGISNMYANREPRFYASVMYQGRSWHDIISNRKNKATRVYFSTDFNSSEAGYGGIASSKEATGVGYPSTGYLGYKFMNRTIHPTIGNGVKSVYRPSIIFRLADFYLLYAETLNEINPNDPNIVVYLDKVRERAGIPGYAQMESSGTKTGIIGNQDAMRKAIRNERQVELFCEGQRYFDVRRWLIADKPEGRQYGNFTGMNMTGKESDRSFYRRVNSESSPRIFERKMYLHPIPLSEIEINEGKLKQNPGY